MGHEAHPTMFRGANKLTLDVKGRMVMPTRYRERLQERCGGKLVITVDAGLSVAVAVLVTVRLWLVE